MLFDDKLLSALPAPSRSKIEQLDSERDARHFTVRSTSEALEEARHDHGVALSRAKQAHQENYYARDVEADAAEAAQVEPQRRNDRLAQAVRLLEPVTVKGRVVQRAQDTHDRAVQRWRETDFLPAAHQWLQRIVASAAALRHAPLPQPGKAKTLPDAVAALRAQLAELDAAWAAAESAPDTRDAFRARAIAEIDALAARGALTVDLRDRSPAPVRLAEHLSISLATFGDKEFAVNRLIGDPGPFHVWLHRDALLSRINELIDAANDAGALSFEAREKRFADITAQRLALEFQEEAAICAAAASGQSIPRRRDCDPRCVLEVQEQ
jgi:hypothetical protein